MSDIVYLNGRYLPRDQAAISPDDRGFIFADGVYEVVRYYGGRPFAMDAHLRRLQYSLGELRIVHPDVSFEAISRELVERNRRPECYVYWQVTRGVAIRNHAFPDPPVPPTVYAFVKPQPPLDLAGPPKPMAAITHRETRWACCAIKSIALLPNVLAREAAADAGADEAIFVREGSDLVTEGTARSVFAVIEGQLRTHPLDGSILGSITRAVCIELAGELGLAVREEAFTRDRMLAADELFAAGTTTEVRPVTEVDGQPIADGECGPVTRQLGDALRRRIVRECGLE